MISDIAVSVFCIFMGVISLPMFGSMYSASRMKIDEISYTKKKMKVDFICFLLLLFAYLFLELF